MRSVIPAPAADAGATTTPCDIVMVMAMANNLDRFHLLMDVIDGVPDLG